MLKKIYGEMILKKDFILYHTSDEKFSYKPDIYVNLNLKGVNVERIKYNIT